MKIDFYKFIINLLLLVIIILLIYISFNLNSISKNGRFQLYGETILDTRTGKFIRIDNMRGNDDLIK